MLTTNKSLSASALGRWPLITGNLTLKCVGTLTKCPYTAGGRSRRGSPKAGTTVRENSRPPGIVPRIRSETLFVCRRDG